MRKNEKLVCDLCGKTFDTPGRLCMCPTSLFTMETRTILVKNVKKRF